MAVRDLAITESAQGLVMAERRLSTERAVFFRSLVRPFWYSYL
jgi:hypothetical protein